MKEDYIASLYREMELYLIRSMQRNLGRHIAEETKTGLQYPQWQALKLQSLRRYQKQNKAAVKAFTKSLPKEIREQMKTELRQGRKSEMKRYRAALGKGWKSAVTMKDSFFKVNRRMADRIIDSLENDLDKANTAVFRMMNDVYRQTIYKAVFFAGQGAQTPQQAYDMAVKDFLSAGINCITYKDGRRINIADYADMAVKTGIKRAKLAGDGDFRQEIGNPLVIVSKHGTSCDDCGAFEGRVLIDDVYSGGTQAAGDYLLLSEAMKQGLLHPRCRHGLNTFYPELEDINHYGTPEHPLNEYGSDKANKAHAENMVQRYKRLSEGSVDPENVRKYREILGRWQERLRALDKDEKRGIINNEERGMANGLRASPHHRLTAEEIAGLQEDIRQIQADENVFIFNSGKRTIYNDEQDLIFVRGDVLPTTGSDHPRDRMSSRAVLAHEYYGHRANRGTKLPAQSWNDEFRASYMAARNSPGLSLEDRRYLILDALERAKEAGVTVHNNSFIRRILYGY